MGRARTTTYATAVILPGSGGSLTIATSCAAPGLPIAARDNAAVSWTVSAVRLPDGDHPVDLWVDASGALTHAPIAGAERLPGRFVMHGLVDAHAHPTVASGEKGPVRLSPDAAQALLIEWARSGVSLVRDVGSPGGMALDLEALPGMPRFRPAGRFLAPEGRYFPALLPEGTPEDLLTEHALVEVARGAIWVKVIADFAPIVDGMPSGPASANYSTEAVAAMVDAVHAAGGRVAAHSTTDTAAALVAAGVDSIEHGTGIDETILRAMAEHGTAWTPTLCAVLRVPDQAPDSTLRRVAEYRERLDVLVPLAHRLGVPILTGTDTVGTLTREVALLAQHGLDPSAALAAASTVAYAFLGEDFDRTDGPTSLVTYDADPRNDLDVLSAPVAVLIDGVRVL
jgi:imidazolonepropionase-like amidohydrolase